MADWKGTKVRICVINPGYPPEIRPRVIAEIETYLDTDTMTDIFKKYDLGKYEITISKSY